MVAILSRGRWVNADNKISCVFCTFTSAVKYIFTYQIPFLQYGQWDLNKSHDTVGVKQQVNQTSDWVVKFNVLSPERLPWNPVLCGACIPNVPFNVQESMANPTLELLGLVAECSICRLMYSVQAQWPSAGGKQELWYHYNDITWTHGQRGIVIHRSLQNVVQLHKSAAWLVLCVWNPLVTDGFTLQMASDRQLFHLGFKTNYLSITSYSSLAMSSQIFTATGMWNIFLQCSFRSHLLGLKYWGLNRIVDSLQTTFPKTFSLEKSILIQISLILWCLLWKYQKI